MSFGSQIAKRRKEIKMTQMDLAGKLGVSFQAVSSWERDELQPEFSRLYEIADALRVKISYLFEEEKPLKHWELHDAMFSADNMRRRVTMYVQARNLEQSKNALRIMLKAHKGAKRKSKLGENIPYAIHPLMMACHAFALNIYAEDLEKQDAMIATLLLHDVVEDTPITINELEVNDDIKTAVDLVTYKYDSSMDEKEYTQSYYEGIKKNEIASIVKVIDRCNNVSTMATGFENDKIIQYIEETEEYILPLLDYIKYEYNAFYDAAFLLKYQLLSVMESLKRTVH